MIPHQWIELGFVGSIRISTLLTASVVFIYVLVRTRSFFIAFVSTMAWASLYEIFFVITDSIIHNMPWSRTFWIVIALIAYPILAHTQGIRPNRLLLLIFSLTWIIWVLFGFNYNSYNNPTFIPQNELLNVLSKTILALAYALSEFTIKKDKLRFWF
ncbi:MAG: hypothetical protein NWF08_05600 [Candidatus Bathyarchaeota archaeon]|nr:hypothetical protein [Candidatus Bathyarchaeota archaeon]